MTCFIFLSTGTSKYRFIKREGCTWKEPKNKLMCSQKRMKIIWRTINSRKRPHGVMAPHQFDMCEGPRINALCGKGFSLTFWHGHKHSCTLQQHIVHSHKGHQEETQDNNNALCPCTYMLSSHTTSGHCSETSQRPENERFKATTNNYHTCFHYELVIFSSFHIYKRLTYLLF